MSQIESIDLRTTTRVEMIDVTSLIRSAIKKSGVQSGLAAIHCPHTTAGLTIQENADPDVKSDLLAHLGRLVPEDAGFRHSEGNSDAHIKSSLVGPALTLIVDAGRPLLGTWQAVFFCEFDGPRDRRIHVKVLPG